MKNKAQKKGKTFKMIVAGLAALVVLLIATPIAFFASIGSEWETRKDIKSVRNSLHIDNSKSILTEISQNDRVLEVIAVDKDGAVIYTLNAMPLFADTGATVLYDNQTGLIKFDSGRISYLQRNSILGSLLNVGDDDWDFDDDDEDDRIPSFDYRFVRDNTYQTIALNDSVGNAVYIVCSQNVHLGFVLFLVFTIIAWSLLMLYFAIVIGHFVFKMVMYVDCHSCKEQTKRHNKHCTKCGATLDHKRCASCNAIASKSDLVCGKCGKKLDE